MSDITLQEALRIVGREDLAKTASADEHYTFSDKNATFVSYVNAHVKEANDETKATCEKYAKFWRIADECKTAAETIAGLSEGRKLAADDFALVQDELIAYPAYDANTVVKAATALTEERAKYPLEWCKTAAARILSRAQIHGTHIPEYAETALHKMAGLGYATPTSVEEMLVQRLNLRKVAGADEMSEKLASVLGAMMEDDQLCLDPQIVKTAMDTIEDYDTQQDLTQYYGVKLACPEEIIDDRMVTSRLEKVANAHMLNVELTNGASVDVTTLSKEALAAIDEDLAQMKTAQLIEVLPTLPRDSADLLVRLI